MSLSTKPRTPERAAEIKDRLQQMSLELSRLSWEAKNIGALSDTDMRHEDIAWMRHITGSLEVVQYAVNQLAYRWSLTESGRQG